MKIPLQIVCRNFELTGAIEEAIRDKATKLSQFHDQITRCKITVAVPHRRSRKGILYNVRVDITVPGSEIVVKREPNEDIYVSIRDAFDTAQRRLKSQAQVRRGEVKFHEEPVRGHVRAIFLERGYGFLTTSDDREIYFHKNSVVGDRFKDLKIGTEVRFVEALGEKGPQASTVKVIRA
jgi:ribosomal subunit interface protein